MKTNWEVKKLGDVIEIRNGKNQQRVLSKDGQYPVMGSAGNVMGYAIDYICEAGTTIIGRKGNISKPIFINERFWNVDTAFGFYPKNKNEIDKKLVYYLCLGVDFEKMNRGTTIPSLVKSELQKIQIRIPPQNEQQHIVSILDESFADISKAKDKAEQNLKNAKELFESYLESVFKNKKWEEKKLGNVCEIKGRIGYRGYTVKDLVSKGEGAITLSPSNIKNNIFITNKCTYISWFKYEQSPEIMVFNGDILFVKTGSTYGKVALVENLPEKATINPQFVVLKDIKCNNKFLYYYLTTKIFKEKVEKIVGGTATPTLSQTNLSEQMVLIPSEKEQNEIVKKLDALSIETKKLEAIYEQKLNNLEELKKSVLQKAFNGEL